MAQPVLQLVIDESKPPAKVMQEMARRIAVAMREISVPAVLLACLFGFLNFFQGAPWWEAILEAITAAAFITLVGAITRVLLEPVRRWVLLKRAKRSR